MLQIWCGESCFSKQALDTCWFSTDTSANKTVKRRKLVQQVAHHGIYQRKYWSDVPLSPCALCHTACFGFVTPLITGSWIIFQFHKVSYQPSELLLSRHFLTEMSVALLPTAWIHSGCSHSLQQWCRTWFRSPLWVPSHHCPSCSLPCCWSLSGWWQQWQPAGLCVVT